MRCAIWAVVLALGCGPDAKGGAGGSAGKAPMGGSAADTAGAGGRAGGATGGSAGSGGVSCEQEWSAYEVLAAPARRCDPMAAVKECDWNVVLFTRCGCTIPANDSSSEYAAARRLAVKYSEHCEWPEPCDSCPATIDAACKDDGTGTFVCVYQ